MRCSIVAAVVLLFAGFAWRSSAAPAAPSNVRVATNNPFTITVTWRDNSTNESKFLIASGIAGTGSFSLLGETPANITNYRSIFQFSTAGQMTPGTTNVLFVRAAGPTYTTNLLDAADSSQITFQMPRFDAPTNLTATNLTATGFRLRWRDNTTNEASFTIGYRLSTNSGYSLYPANFIGPNTTNYDITGLSPATFYQFAVQADYSDAFSTNGVLSLPVSVTTPNAFVSRRFHPAVVGQAISPYTLVASTNLGAPTNYSIVGSLPPGLTFNSTNRTITGTPTQAGIYTPGMVASYATNGSITNTLTFRVIHPPGPPAITATLTNRTFTRGGPGATIPLTSFFADRDTEKAVRFLTTKGTIDVALYAAATPQTVSNFLNYVNRGDYTGSVVHRAPLNFVVQGGGFRTNATGFAAIVTDPSPTNEPGIRQAAGTIAMAKVGGQPNSATSQWFFNLGDNSFQLDDQNEGFTAFGRILSDGLQVCFDINNLPRASYSIPVGGTPSGFDDFPVDASEAPGTYDPATAVVVAGVIPIEPLSFSVSCPTGTNVVSAAVNGTNLVITPVTAFGGVTTLTVTATDLDGNSTNQTFLVTVDSPYANWLNQFQLTNAPALPGADPDFDTLPNAVEFALMGNPNSADAAGTRARQSIVTNNNEQFLALTFKLRKDLGGATVSLRGGTNLVPAQWTNLWTSTNLLNPPVHQLVDQTNFWLITVRDLEPVNPGPTQRNINLRVQAP